MDSAVLFHLKWLSRKVIVGLDTLTNSRFQFGHVGEDTPMQCSPFQLREPAFHGVQPRSTGRHEVKFETRVFLQPLLDGRCFVRRAVVRNYMQVKFCGRHAVDLSRNARNSLLDGVGLSAR